MSWFMEEKLFYQRIKDDTKRYENNRKILTGKRDDHTTCCLLDYPYFKESYEIIAIDLSKQLELGADHEAIKPVNFTENLDRS